MNPTLAGSLGGLAATVPMTVAMETMFRRLPATQRYPLPSRGVAMNVLKTIGVEHQLNEPERHAFTLLSHFGYGTLAGAAYGSLARRWLPGIAGGIWWRARPPRNGPTWRHCMPRALSAR